MKPCLFLLLLLPLALLAEPATPNRRLLGEFGPYATPAEAYATLDIALRTMVEQGGGLLEIPADAPAGFYPRNRLQQAFNTPAVTVVDLRGGVEHRYLPPLGAIASDASGGGSFVLERDAAANFPWQGAYSTQYISSRFRGGSSSYMNTLTRPVAKGPDARFYVESHRGLFAGQTVRVTGEPRGYSGDGEYIPIKSLGLDGTDPYFVADAAFDHPNGALVYNKNVVNGLTVNDVTNSDNQSMSLAVNKTAYGVGDTFVVSAALHYQGNVMSAAGDEGGLCFAGDIVQDPQIFAGTVESWTPDTLQFIYRPGATAPQKIGTSRPLINLNPAKWVTSGKVMVIPPGFAYLRTDTSNLNPTLLIGSAETRWDESVVGRFIAIDEPTETYAPDEPLSHGYAGAPRRTLRRWWHITGIEPRPDGRTNLYVERTVWWTSRRMGPTLMLWDNYTTGANHERELAYIIAPGAWVSDPRQGICGDLPGNVGAAYQHDRRLIVLAPFPEMNGPLGFAAGDPFEQPLGPDVWLPSGVRIRHHQGYPGHMAGATFEAVNLGKTQVGAALGIGGPYGPLDEVTAKQKDRAPSFGAGIQMMASMGSGIVMRGPVKDYGIDFWQYDRNPKKLFWRNPTVNATLSVDPETAAFVFQGGPLDLSQRGTVRQQGLSATHLAARNLRGIRLPVPAGAASLTVTFPTPEPDANYSLTVQATWFTMDRLADRQPQGFTVEFSVPAPEAATIDWQLIR